MAETDDSPCGHICLMDYAAGHCIGCSNYTSGRKREVLAALEARRAAVQTTD